MAKTAVYDYSTTASSNSDFDGTDSSGATGKVKDGDNYARSIASHVKGFALDLGAVNTVGGTADAITVTLSSAPSALVDGMRITINASAANTGATTLNVTPAGGSAFGAKKVMKWSAGSEAELSANDIPAANALIELVYDSARNAAAGAWMLLGTSVAAATTSAAGIVELAFNAPYNLGVAASVAANALTIALKDADGNDPTVASPVVIPYRNVTAGTGTPSYLTITAATSIVVSSGSTLGTTSGVAFALWLVSFNDGGTQRLGIINCTTVSAGSVTIYPLGAWGIASSTAEGGAGGADSAQTFYTGSAVTSKSYTVLAKLFFESGIATAGTWDAAPTRIQLYDQSVALPGTTVQVRRTQTGAVATGTTSTPIDDSIPQQSEMDIYMSQAITPTSTANVLAIDAVGVGAGNAGGGRVPYALFQDSTANALAAIVGSIPATDQPIPQPISFSMVAGTTSSTTFKFGSSDGGGTWTFNGTGAARLMGGAMASYIRVEEIAS